MTTFYKKPSLFWDVTQRRLVIIYRCFGTTYKSNLQRSVTERRHLDPWWWNR